MERTLQISLVDFVQIKHFEVDNNVIYHCTINNGLNPQSHLIIGKTN